MEIVKEDAVDMAVTGKTVLVVDDEGGVRRLVCRLCKKIGISKVLDAENAKDALELLEKNHVDLVISDLNIPDDCGLKIVRAVKQERKHTVVLIFSGSCLEEDHVGIREAGADMVIVKGTDLSVLEDAIRKLLHLGPANPTGGN